MNTYFPRMAIEGYVYVLCRGSVEIFLDGEGGALTSVGVRRPGEILGEINALDGLGHSAHVIARERCQTLSMNAADFNLCLETFPRFSTNIARLLAARVRYLTARSSRMNGDADTRICGELVCLAEHYRQEGENNVIIPIRLTQGDLAAMTNLSRQQVNKVLGRLKERGWVSTDSRCRVTIHDFSRLHAECNENSEAFSKN